MLRGPTAVAVRSQLQPCGCLHRAWPQRRQPPPQSRGPGPDPGRRLCCCHWLAVGGQVRLPRRLGHIGQPRCGVGGDLTARSWLLGGGAHRGLLEAAALRDHVAGRARMGTAEAEGPGAMGTLQTAVLQRTGPVSYLPSCPGWSLCQLLRSPLAGWSLACLLHGLLSGLWPVGNAGPPLSSASRTTHPLLPFMRARLGVPGLAHGSWAGHGGSWNAWGQCPRQLPLGRSGPRIVKGNLKAVSWIQAAQQEAMC